MFHRGGLLAVVAADDASGAVTLRLVLQPDGDALFKIDVAHTTDPALPLQVQRMAAGLVAELSSAQRSIDALRRTVHSGATVLLGGIAAGGAYAVSDLVFQALIVAAFLSAGAMLRRLLGFAISWALRRAVR
jgi:hypothetical protein